MEARGAIFHQRRAEMVIRHAIEAPKTTGQFLAMVLTSTSIPLKTQKPSAVFAAKSTENLRYSETPYTVRIFVGEDWNR